MAIQEINLGTAPTGAGGDTQRSANTKINQNFSNPDHAASRLIGYDVGKIPLAEEVRKALFSRIDGDKNSGNANDFEPGTIWWSSYGVENRPEGFSATRFNIETKYIGAEKKYQIAYGWDVASMAHRSLSGSWSEWQPLGWDKKNYNTTSALAANVVVDTDGRLLRSTSSEKYKKILGSLELTDEFYDKAIAVKPIIYRSKAELDPDSWHFMSFSAEEVGALDPALTYWKAFETDPETGEKVELEQKEAEGINLNAICAVLHATNIKQNEMIKSLEQRVTALEGQ